MRKEWMDEKRSVWFHLGILVRSSILLQLQDLNNASHSNEWKEKVEVNPEYLENIFYTHHPTYSVTLKPV